jgi:hypothetical protein
MFGCRQTSQSDPDPRHVELSPGRIGIQVVNAVGAAHLGRLS